MSENPLLNEKQAKEELAKLNDFITRQGGEFDLIFLFGVAFDKVNPTIDRDRFATAIKYFINTEKDKNPNTNQGSIRKKLFICVDPNLTENNITQLFVNLNTKLKESPPYVYSAIINDQIGGNPITVEEYKNYIKEQNNSSLANFRIVNYGEADTNFVNLSLYFLKKDELGEIDTYENSIDYSIYFMRYGVESKRYVSTEGRSMKNNIGHFYKNQFNIQKGTKRIQNYLDMEDCHYAPDSFYGSLEKLGRHAHVKDIYMASAMNAHGSGTLSKNGIHYGERSGIIIGNRYFETTCEVLTLLDRLQKTTKNVFYLILDEDYRAFNREGTPRNSKAPYIVSFNHKTTFFRNEPFPFYRIGGKRKQTRKGRISKRKTRKH